MVNSTPSSPGGAPDPVGNDRPSVPRRSRSAMIRRTVRFALHILASAVVGTVLLALLLVWRLQQGPIEISFLRPLVEQALNPPDSRFAVTVDAVQLAWRGGAEEAAVTAHGVHLRTPAGAELAVLPDLAVQLGAHDLMLGRAELRAVTVLSPRILLRRAADGSLDLAFAQPSAGSASETAAEHSSDLTAADSEGEAAPGTPEAMDELLGPPHEGGMFGQLRQVAVKNAELVVQDALLGKRWSVPDVDLMVTRDEAGADVVGSAALPENNGRIALRFGYGFSSRAGLVEIDFDAIRPTLLPLQGTLLNAVRNVDIALSGHLKAEVSAAKGVGLATLDLVGQDGRVHLEQPPISLHDRPWPVHSLQAHLEAEPGAATLDVQSLRIDMGGPVLAISGRVSPDGEAQRAAFDIALTDVPTDRLAELWPAQVAWKPRTWILDNVQGGSIDKAAVHVDVLRDATGVHVPAAGGHVSWHGADVTYLPGLPPLTGVSAEADLDAKTIRIRIDGGRQSALKLGDIRNTGSTAVITGLDGEEQFIDLDVGVAGGIPAVLELLDKPRLGYPAKLGIAPPDVQGELSGRLKMHFPLLRALKLEQIQLTASATADKVKTAPLVAGRSVTGGPLQIDLDTDKLKIAGDAALAGIAGKVAWTEVFDPAAGTDRTRIAFDGPVTAAQLKGLGVDTAPYLSGSVGTELLYTQRGTARSIAIDADLTRAGLAVAEVGFAKPVGQAATLSLTVPLGAGGKPSAVQDIVLTGKGLALRGSARLDGDGNLVSADVKQLRFGRSDARLAVTPLPGGGRRVTVRGKAIDASELMKQLESGSGEADPTDTAPRPPMDVSVDVGRLYTGADSFVGPLKADARHDGLRWQQARADSGLPGGGTLSLALVPEARVQRLTLAASDMGAALKGLGLWDALGGGTLQLDATRPRNSDGAPFRGHFSMENYRLLDAPLLATVLNAATEQPVDRWQEGGAFVFNRVDGDFSFDGALLKLWKTRHAGGTLGLTTEGEIDIAGSRIAMQGTIVPLYGLNGLLGEIPLLGRVLVGGEGEGVFAATYSLDGALADPRVTVNPLAMLAPGFLRNLFFLESDPPRLPDPSAATKRPAELVP